MRTLNDLFFHHLDHYRFDRLLSVSDASGSRAYSTVQFAQAAYALQRRLRASGLVPGDRVAIFADSRPEWHIADFGIQLARLVTVPIYATLSASQVRYVLEHSGCRAVLVMGRARRATIEELLPELPALEIVISLDEIAAPNLPAIIRETTPPSDTDWLPLRTEAEAIDPNEMATIVYTSGTTGPPKGVMLSHANIMFDLERCIERLEFRSTHQALSVLPLSHVFERLLCYGYIRQGVPIAYGDPHDLGRLVKEHHPMVLGCVPRVLEKIHETVQAKIRALPSWMQRISERLIKGAIEVTRERDGQGRASLSAKALGFLADLVVFRKVRRELGGLHYLVCGGAWLDPRLEEFFRAAGFTVLQGYGLTETSPVICLNGPGHETPGSVGPPLRGIEVRTSPEGELMVRGANVMLGYFEDAEGTPATLEDGWLRTGDLGHIDSEGNVYVTGRCREILVLSTGKNVCCPLVERVMLQSPLIQDAFILGHGRKFVTAVIVPHRANLRAAADELGLAALNDRELLQSPAIADLYRRDVEARQESLSHYERVKRFGFLPPEAMADRDLVTPTLKVRRNVLESKYGKWIDSIYETDAVVILGGGRQADSSADWEDETAMRSATS